MARRVLIESRRRSGLAARGASVRAIQIGLTSLMMLGCGAVRYVDRSKSFEVNGDEARRIDDLDASSPSEQSSKDRDPPPRRTKVTRDDCTYWRKARTDATHETKTVKKYIQARTESVCVDFPDVFEDTPPAELDKIIAKHTADFHEVVGKEQGNLNPFEPRGFNLARGSCYVVVLRLLPGFEPYEEAKRAVRLTAVSDGAQMVGLDTPGTVLASDHLRGHGAVIDVGCPIRAGGIHLAADPPQVAVGNYSAELRSKPISQAELARLEEAIAGATAKRAAENVRHLDQVCADCQDMYNYCVAHPGPGTFDCRASWVECLEVNASATMRDCHY